MRLTSVAKNIRVLEKATAIEVLVCFYINAYHYGRIIGSPKPDLVDGSYTATPTIESAHP